MPKANNNVVGRKKCPLCPNGHWDIKHFNNQTYEPKYASGSCGCQMRSKAHQEIFDIDETVTDKTDHTDVPPVRDEPPIKPEPTREPIVVENVEDEDKNKKSDWWDDEKW